MKPLCSLLACAIVLLCLVPVMPAHSLGYHAVVAPQRILLLGGTAPAVNGAIKDIEFIPESTKKQSGERKGTMHTCLRIMLRPGNQPRVLSRTLKPTTAGLPPTSGELYNTPASLACIYGLAGSPATTGGCNPNQTTQYNSGGSGVIALVDAYDDATAAADLAAFSTQFGLPAANFSVVYASGTQPSANSGWQTEESLDIEYAHAMAPNAKIILVEAASNSNTDLLTAVNVASNLVAAGGGGIVSMSFGGAEYSGETGYDSTFTKANVIYIASTGDSPGVAWPSTSPNVIAAGGTTLIRNGSGSYTGQTAWSSGGGGPSAMETIPAFQNSISGIVGSARGVPDISFEADPSTGVWIYAAGTWEVVGGTSLSAPALAGIINSAGQYTSSNALLTQIYSAQSNVTYGDVTGGTCGSGGSYSAVTGWDFCTGKGTPSSITSKPVGITSPSGTPHPPCSGFIALGCRQVH